MTHILAHTVMNKAACIHACVLALINSSTDIKLQTCTNFESDHWPVLVDFGASSTSGNGTQSSGGGHKGVIIAVVVILVCIVCFL